MYELYEKMTFPCGCEGCFVPVKRKNDKICLLIFVNPECNFDRNKVGKDLGFVKYLSFDVRGEYSRKEKRE